MTGSTGALSRGVLALATGDPLCLEAAGDHLVGRGPVESVALRAHSYFGVFSIGTALDRATLLRGIEWLRPEGARASQLMRVLLIGPHAIAAAWVHGREEMEGVPRPPIEIRCRRGWAVVTGQPLPSGGETFESWLARGLAGEWQTLIGADGPYSAALHLSDGLALVQDRFGLYRQVYAQQPEGVWFSTSTNALAAVRGIELVPHTEEIAAMGVNLVRREHASPFRNIGRPLANTGLWFGAVATSPRTRWGRNAFPRPEPARRRSVEEITEDLNDALLVRLRRTVREAESAGLEMGVWLTSGVDSRWISAGLRRLGVPASYWTIGTPGTLDLEIAKVYTREIGARHHAGLVHSLDDVLRPLPETNWWLEGRVSLAHQFTGSIWEELQSAGRMMLQGYFMNWMKWILPKHAHRKADLLGAHHPLEEARERYIADQRDGIRKYGAALLLPALGEIVDQTIREVLDRARPERSYHMHLAMQLDGGPVERATALPRLSHVLGGADLPLMDTRIIELGLEASLLPYAQRRRVQPNCIAALDPASAQLPSTPWSLPPVAMTGSRTRVAAYALRHPSWYPKMVLGRRRKTISPNPIREQLLGSNEMLAFAKAALFERGHRLADAFGELRMAALLDATIEQPTHRRLGFLWGIVALELYMEAFERARAGKPPTWESLPIRV